MTDQSRNRQPDTTSTAPAFTPPPGGRKGGNYIQPVEPYGRPPYYDVWIDGNYYTTYDSLQEAETCLRASFAGQHVIQIGA